MTTAGLAEGPSKFHARELLDILEDAENDNKNAPRKTSPCCEPLPAKKIPSMHISQELNTRDGSEPRMAPIQHRYKARRLTKETIPLSAETGLKLQSDPSHLSYTEPLAYPVPVCPRLFDNINDVRSQFVTWRTLPVSPVTATGSYYYGLSRKTSRVLQTIL